MINTTGMIGYFQRVFAMGLLPPVPVLSAHPAIRFDRDKKSLMHILDLHETLDKGLNTHRAIQAFHVPPSKIIIMGDSGGDGPHFKWGQDHGAYLIGSMIKPSLMKYCQDNTLTIDHLFGIHYREGDEIDRHLEMQADFMALAPAIEALLQQL
jgi:hypothetical protein